MNKQNRVFCFLVCMDNKYVQLEHDSHAGAASETLPLSIFVKDMESPSNVGSIFRIADALGVEKIYLSGNTQTPPNTKIRRVSRAAELYVDYEYVNDPIATLESLKTNGYEIVGLDITSESIDLAEFDVNPESKICLVLGSERSGIHESLLKLCDATVHIPMVGHKSSMNVGNACAISVYSLGLKLRSI